MNGVSRALAAVATVTTLFAVAGCLAGTFIEYEYSHSDANHHP
jgi:hypothetical protein